MQAGPPRRADRLTAPIEALGGLLGGLLVALPAALAGRLIGAVLATGWSDLVGVVLGGLLGYTLGVGIGVAVAARRLGRGTSVWPALLGSLAGGGLVLVLAEPLGLNRLPGLLWSAGLLVPPLLAVLAGRWRRGRDSRRDG